MLLVIPSIELKNGFCTRCIIGEKGTEGYYQRLSRDPVELVKLLRRENTKTIHIIDDDAIINSDNISNYTNIKYISSVLDIPVEVFGKFDTYEKCTQILDDGIYRIFVDELLIKSPNAVKDLISKYSYSRIAFNSIIDSDDMEINIEGTNILLNDYYSMIKEVNGKRIIFGKKSWQEDEKLDFDLIKKIALDNNFKITVSEGINTPEILWKLSEYTKIGIDSVVIGKALYDNNFPCQKIWRLIEARQEPITKNHVRN